MRKLWILILLIVLTCVLVACTMALNSSSSATFDLTKSHHGEDSFKSKSQASFFQWLSMRVEEGSYPEPTETEIKSIVQTPDRELVHSSAEIPRATWLGHASVLVQYKDINFLTDPHLTDRPAPVDFLVSKRLTPPALKFEELPKIDFIVVSHNHYDHLDHRTVDMYGDSVVWFVPLGLKAWFLDRGINTDRVVELDWWESYPFSDEVTLTLTPSVHWSKRSPWDTNQSLWGAWSVQIAGFKSWFAGDTAYDEKVFKEVGERTGPYDMAFIPIGAYGPRYFMSVQHVDPVQAVSIHQDIKAKVSIPIHWGSFQLTHEPFLEPPRLLKEAMINAGLEDKYFTKINIGATLQQAITGE